jgi:hypothetical protein
VQARAQVERPIPPEVEPLAHLNPEAGQCTGRLVFSKPGKWTLLKNEIEKWALPGHARSWVPILSGYPGSLTGQWRGTEHDTTTFLETETLDLLADVTVLQETEELPVYCWFGDSVPIQSHMQQVLKAPAERNLKRRNFSCCNSLSS